MISVDRSSVPIPEAFTSERVLEEKQRVREEAQARVGELSARSKGLVSLARDYAYSGVLRSQGFVRPDFAEWLGREARPTLKKLFSDRCAYCESALDSQPGDIELFRPRLNARNADGSADTLYYFWLDSNWDNTLLACALCSRGKGSRFPIAAKERVALFEENPARLAEEKPLLVDPCTDDPTEHLSIYSSGLMLPLSERGRYTIEILDLNREPLVEARGNAWNLAQMHVENNFAGREPSVGEVEASLGRLLDPSLPYQYARRMGAYSALQNAPLAFLLPKMSREWRERWRVWLPGHLTALRLPPPPPIPPPPPPMPVPAFSVPGSLPPAKFSLPAVDAPKPGKSGSTGSFAAVPATLPVSRDSAKEAYEAERRRQKAYSIEAEDAATRITYFTSSKRVGVVRLRNFKAIGELALQFPLPEIQRESWLMLLGENGCGKSSILQAIALTLMGEEHANALGLDARRYVRRAPGVQSGEVLVYLSGVGPIRLRFSLDSPRFTVDPPEPKVLLLGYGATRLLPRMVKREASTQKAIRVLNLFDPTAPLADTENWLLDRDRVSDAQLRVFRDDIIRLLMLPEDTQIYRDNGQVEMDYFGTRKALRDMSDGYQSIIALAGDISIGIRDWWGGLREAEGIVLLDEIEVHLHPRWKISIVERLRQTCPRLSFIVSTHDPLCLKGLRSEEVVVLRKGPDRDVEAITNVPRIEHLRADQLLSSFLFDLPSTRSAATAMNIARYAELVGYNSRSPSEERELEELKSRLDLELSSAISPMQQRIEKSLLASLMPESIDSERMPGELTAERLEMMRQLNEMLGGDPEESSGGFPG